jgi:hypothetical protein
MDEEKNFDEKTKQGGRIKYLNAEKRKDEEIESKNKAFH